MAKKQKTQTMQSKKLAKAKAGPSTQQYLDIAEIREDVVVLKDGTVRGVLLVSSINFALKSQEEQQAIIQGYMQFLNSLEYPLQIVIQSRKMNIDSYLHDLREQYKSLKNELLRTQIQDYIVFIRELVELGDIMTKRVYLTAQYNPLSDRQKNFFTRFGDVLSPSSITKLNRKKFDERKSALDKRISIIQSGLGSMGLQSARLDTQSLMELFYNVYNPDVASVQKLTDIEKLRIEGAGTPSI